MLGLSESLKGLTATDAYRDATRHFADTTIRPLWRSACASLAGLVDVPDGARLWFDTGDIAALQSGEKESGKAMQVNASAASTLIMAGYEPDSVTRAVVAGDMSLLVHTGKTSVQLYPDGNPPTPGGSSE